MQKNILAKVIIIFILGGFAGYYLNYFTRDFSADDLKESALMMTGNGANMMQMAQMMTGVGNMMQERGKKYKDLEMMQRGSEFEKKGEMMEKNGNEMMYQGGGMMEMVK